MKKILSVILVCAIMFATIPFGAFTLTASAATEYTEGYYTYTVENGEATITNINEEIRGDVTIPDTLGGYPVTSIDRWAISSYSNIKSLTIPASITSIGSAITCLPLEEIIVSQDNVNYLSENGVLFNKDKTVLLTYPCSKPDAEYTIPNTVETIGDRAFYNCYDINSVTIPDNVITIGENAFYHCFNLENVVMGNSVEIIKPSAFFWCSKITSINLPNSLKAIYNHAFGNTAITSLNIPENVQLIASEGIFTGCVTITEINVDENNAHYSSQDGVLFNKAKTELLTYPGGKEATKYTVPDSVIKITNTAFDDCQNLTSIIIPASVVIIAAKTYSSNKEITFVNCVKLAEINVDENNAYYSSENGVLFNKDKSQLLVYPSYKADTEYTIPTTVKTISEKAFYKCKLIKSIIMTENVISMGDEVFRECENLESIIIPEGVTSIGYDAFFVCDNLTIYGYAGSYAETYANENDIPFVAIEETPLFPDTNVNDWYYESVEYVVSAGIMSGYSNGKFGTSDSIQRQDFLVMLARLDGVNLDEYEDQSDFPDVAQSGYYKAAVNWGSENGIVTGYQNGKFGVGDKVTREQLVTFLYRYAKHKEYDYSCTEDRETVVSGQYNDYKKVSGFAKDPILWAIEKGVISGKTSSTIAPQGNAQRCEVAKIMYNIYLNDIFK